MIKKDIKRILAEREKKVVLFSNKPIHPSAVLIPLYKKNGEYHVLLTKRTEELDLESLPVLYISSHCHCLAHS